MKATKAWVYNLLLDVVGEHPRIGEEFERQCEEEHRTLIANGWDGTEEHFYAILCGEGGQLVKSL
jgi:hypothetical protein